MTWLEGQKLPVRVESVRRERKYRSEEEIHIRHALSGLRRENISGE